MMMLLLLPSPSLTALARVLRMSRTQPNIKAVNRPSTALIDCISYRQLIDHRLIVDIPSLGVYREIGRD